VKETDFWWLEVVMVALFTLGSYPVKVKPDRFGWTLNSLQILDL